MAKTKKLNRKELEKLASALPGKDRADFLEQDITKAWLEEQIEYRKGLMKRDAYIGFPWFIAYSASLFMVGMTWATITIFVIGVVYFVYTIFTTGSYGDNRKRVQVYEELLKKL
jgi:hypothetical protein